ncbi:glycosyltransferase [Shewanella algae]|uniref:glycosyltransferase n=1 Tax=Shewanella algae TaxID=38313 RepID=UPI00399B3E78
MLFVVSNFVMNGGTTFVFRMAEERYKRGLATTILSIESNVNKELVARVKEFASFYLLEDFVTFGLGKVFVKQLVITAPLKKAKLKKVIDDSHGNVHCMGVYGLLLSRRFSQFYPKKLNITTAVYHQNEYLFKSKKYYFKDIFELILQSFSSDQMIFFNEKNRQDYANKFNLDFEKSPLTPIGLNLSDRVWRSTKTDSDKLKIISIGNLFDFKKYIEAMIENFNEILRLDDRFEFHIYGDGPEKDRLYDLVLSKGLSGKVFLHGQFDYALLTDVVRGSFAFLGGGTAIIEASSYGIPSIIGIESFELPETYGFFYEINGLDYNEYKFDMPRRSFSNCIRVLLDASEWNDVSHRCYIKSQEFSIEKTLETFELSFSSSALTDIKSVSFSNSRLLISLLSMAFNYYLKLDDGIRNRRLQGNFDESH